MNLRHDWTKEEITAIYDMPFLELIHRAHNIHLENFPGNSVELATLLSIKTGRCPEDCKYCSQSIHYKTSLETEKLMELEDVITAAKKAKESGSQRFCMGSAWRSPTNRQLSQVKDMVREVKALGLETCCTLGMLTDTQAKELKAAGLDFYNHNLDTSPEYYGEVTTTRTYEDRLNTLEAVRNADIKVCCGGIMGMGESKTDRISFLQQLANQPQHPQSVPINQLAAVPGTPFENQKKIDDVEFVRTIATARIIMPKSVVRLSAGRLEMPDLMQAMCFYAGANSCFRGDKLLTVKNKTVDKDQALFDKLGIKIIKQQIDINPSCSKTKSETTEA